MKLPALLITLALTPVIAGAQSTAEMKQDAGTRFDQADKAMNAAYQQLMKILNEEGRKRLRETQRAWITYRDAQAGFDSHHFVGGTAEGLERTGSLELLTRERTKRLIEDYHRFK